MPSGAPLQNFGGGIDRESLTYITKHDNVLMAGVHASGGNSASSDVQESGFISGDELTPFNSRAVKNSDRVRGGCLMAVVWKLTKTIVLSGLGVKRLKVIYSFSFLKNGQFSLRRDEDSDSSCPSKATAVAL